MRYPRLAWLALVCGLAGGLAPGARAQSIAPKYLASDTEIVVTINVAQMLESEVAKKNKDLLQQGRSLVENRLTDLGASKYLEKAGIDLFRDISRVTIAGPGTKDTERGVLVIEGKFTPAKLQSAAEDAARDNPGSITITKVDNQTAYEIPQPNGKTAYLTTLGTNVLLGATSKEVFTATLAQAKSGNTPQLPKGFKALLQTTNDKQSLSVAATGPALARLAENAPNPNEMVAAYLKGVDGISLAFTLSKDVQFELGINAKDKEAAEQFSKLGNTLLIGLRGMIAQKAKEDAKLVPVVEIAQTLQIGTQGNNVILRGEVSYETLGKLLKNLPQQ